eukprot:5988764-Pleurochrysis_carterae.AAC.1
MARAQMWPHAYATRNRGEQCVLPPDRHLSTQSEAKRARAHCDVHVRGSAIMPNNIGFVFKA